MHPGQSYFFAAVKLPLVMALDTVFIRKPYTSYSVLNRHPPFAYLSGLLFFPLEKGVWLVAQNSLEFSIFVP